MSDILNQTELDDNFLEMLSLGDSDSPYNAGVVANHNVTILTAALKRMYQGVMLSQPIILEFDVSDVVEGDVVEDTSIGLDWYIQGANLVVTPHYTDRKIKAVSAIFTSTDNDDDGNGTWILASDLSEYIESVYVAASSDYTIITFTDDFLDFAASSETYRIILL